MRCGLVYKAVTWLPDRVSYIRQMLWLRRKNRSKKYGKQHNV
jgi:hypothetical protein